MIRKRCAKFLLLFLLLLLPAVILSVPAAAAKKKAPANTTGQEQTAAPESEENASDKEDADEKEDTEGKKDTDDKEDPEDGEGTGDKEDADADPEDTTDAGKDSTSVYKGVDYSRVYDYEYYVTHNRQAKRYAGKPEKAIAFFVNRGMKRCHQAIESFDVTSYRYGCARLRKLFGTNYPLYYMHYQTKGYKWAFNRKRATGVTSMQDPVTKYGTIELSSIYDYDYYTRHYPKVVKTIGDDDTAILRFFVEKGMARKHVGKDPDKYKRADPSSATYQRLKKKTSGTYDGTGIIVCIDPGHQRHGNYAREPIGPGSSITKAKVTTGTEGRWSHKTEYQINLEVSLKLRDELKARGYTVVMTRKTHDVSLSNIDRAKIANEADADIFIRIHANGDSNSSVNGVLCYAAATGNPYLKADVVADGQRLARILRDAQVTATKQYKRSNIHQNDMTGINWAKMPTAIVEMGFMSNPTEDRNMANAAFQAKIAKGLANGVDQYFRESAK